MRIQIASDLHLEFFSFKPYQGKPTIEPAPGADLLVLAGDIARDSAALEIFKDWPVPVLYVAGNHEFYKRNHEKLRPQLLEQGTGRVRYLEQDALEINGVRFLGCTLWTDYLLSGDQPGAMLEARNSLNDHKMIRYGNEPFTPSKALALHQASRRWLEEQLAIPYTGKTVVITHHCPSEKSVAEKYLGDPLNAAFASNLDYMVEQADLWIHGHTHCSFDYQLGKCRVVCNPRGYPLSGGGFENPGFLPDLVVEP